MWTICKVYAGSIMLQSMLISAYYVVDVVHPLNNPLWGVKKVLWLEKKPQPATRGFPQNTKGGEGGNAILISLIETWNLHGLNPQAI